MPTEMSSPTAEKDRSGGGPERSLPLIMVLPVAAFLVACLYELLASSSAVLEASSVRVTGTLLVCCSIFSCLCWLAKWLLGFGGQVAAVARALISEATRTRVAPAFLAVLFSALAALALFHSPETPVRYLLQGYLSYSLAITSVLAGLLTLLLSCRTLSHEIEAKLIETLAVKPVGRGSYLAGKWLGLVILNGILLSVAMSAIYIFSVHHIATLPPRDEKDAEAIEEEILTARDLVSAQAHPPVAEQVETELLGKTRAAIERLAHKGHRHSHADEAEEELDEAASLDGARKYLLKHLLRRSRSIAPGKSRSFSFEGLGELREGGSPLRVRYRLASQPGRALASHELTVTMSGGGRKAAFTPAGIGYFELDPSSIDESGRLRITISNPADSPRTVIFSSRNGLEALRARNGFTGNLLRALLVVWIKLSFLSMLGLLCSSFLGFPVAVLLCGLVLLIASTSPFLLQAADMGGSADSPGGFFEVFATTTTQALANGLGRYSEFDPGLRLIDGRQFSWSELGRCFLWIGLLWTGLSGALATIVYRRRELARIQV